MKNPDSRQPPEPRSYRILTLQQWAASTSLGYNTARRLIASGQGPKITQLTERRIGIREDHAREWLDARVVRDRA
jgi:predicted DNA-binding transcriptional regulator AlpA